MNIQPVGDWILVNKTFNDHVRNEDGSIMIYKIDQTVNYTNWVEIVDVGPKCKYITSDMCDGKHFLQAPELSNNMKFYTKDADTGSELFFIRESLFVEDKANRCFVVIQE